MNRKPASDTCDDCGKTEPELHWFASTYRRKELKHQRPDPGNLCGECAGARDGVRHAIETSDD